MKLYEADFYRWTQDTSERLRRGEFSQIDVSALKWDSQPANRSKSWQATIGLQRRRIARLLTQSPSLRPFLSVVLPDAYAEAVLQAIKDTGLNQRTFAEACPYTMEEILNGTDISMGG